MAFVGSTPEADTPEEWDLVTLRRKTTADLNHIIDLPEGDKLPEGTQWGDLAAGFLEDALSIPQAHVAKASVCKDLGIMGLTNEKTQLLFWSMVLRPMYKKLKPAAAPVAPTAGGAVGLAAVAAAGAGVALDTVWQVTADIRLAAKVQGFRAQVVRLARHGIIANTGPESLKPVMFYEEEAPVQGGDFTPHTLHIRSLYFETIALAREFTSDLMGSMSWPKGNQPPAVTPATRPAEALQVSMDVYRNAYEDSLSAVGRVLGKRSYDQVSASTAGTDERRLHQTFASPASVPVGGRWIRCHWRPQRGRKDDFSDHPDNLVFLGDSWHARIDGNYSADLASAVVEPLHCHEEPARRDTGEELVVEVEGYRGPLYRLDVRVFCRYTQDFERLEFRVRDGSTAAVHLEPPDGATLPSNESLGGLFQSFMYTPHPKLAAAFIVYKSTLERRKWAAACADAVKVARFTAEHPMWRLPDPPPCSRGDGFKAAFGVEAAHLLTYMLDPDSPEGVAAQEALNMVEAPSSSSSS